MAHSQQNEATIGVWRRPVPVPSPPPSVRRSCAQSASTAPGSSHASAAADRHGPARFRVPRHRPQSALHSPGLIPRPFRSPDPDEDGPEYYGLWLMYNKIHHVGFSDSVRLGAGIFSTAATTRLLSGLAVLRPG